LVSVAGYPEFREIYDALLGLNFYSVNPERIREVQSPDSGEVLARDGWNLASVLREISRQPKIKERVEEYLSKVVPGVHRADYKALGPKETIEFRQHVKGSTEPWKFFASNMSDGTLRALAILVALFQPKAKPNKGIAFVGIEEPEIALHPAAASVLRDCLMEASQHTQVIVTSHSPELLDDDSISDSSILAVSSSEGTTIVGRMDDAGREAIRNRLYTVGELLRLDQISPVAFTQEELLHSVTPQDKA
jgi:predicted ATPase